MSRVIFNSKFPGETETVTFNFLSRLGVAETISSALVIVSVSSGVDSSPSLLLNGLASIASPLVNQSVKGGVLGVIYSLLCQATTSTGQVLQLSAFLAVQSP